MKINQDIRLAADKKSIRHQDAPSSAGSFRNAVLKESGQMKVSQLNQMITELEAAGSRLSRSRNFQDLVKVKGLVKKIVQEAVDYGMQLKESKSWDYQGNSRSLKLIEQIDDKLIVLTEDIVNKEKTAIDILGTVGEIKGMLVNLYI
ncbi:YaaR family protein [Metabacillus sp. KIGAM252]|uniref:YaaR family protein n=1 Tax=Metabacillus flavus TaxID=2823519 RepID=A0ABS5L945_9BACI|nr:YaaR family protein [Metabacillus flavus]MBS2967245.1 YaaR family protein [Metabacillus flavus]